MLAHASTGIFAFEPKRNTAGENLLNDRLLNNSIVHEQ
jgi:hypothetical protein